MKLTREEFLRMDLRDIAKVYNIEWTDFCVEVFPAERVMWNSDHFYQQYEDWYNRTQNKLAKALK